MISRFGFCLSGIALVLAVSALRCWPVERTLLTGGTLDALRLSKRDGGKRLDTPLREVRYKP
jgi:hypothetical protein